MSRITGRARRARCNGCSLSPLRALTSDPCNTRNLAMSVNPFARAMWRGVAPDPSGAEMSAPRDSSRRTASNIPFSAAMCMGQRYEPSRMPTSAPPTTSATTTGMDPARSARWSGVHPWLSRRFRRTVGLLFMISVLAAPTSPCAHAKCSKVRPSSSSPRTLGSVSVLLSTWLMILPRPTVSTNAALTTERVCVVRCRMAAASRDIPFSMAIAISGMALRALAPNATLTLPPSSRKRSNRSGPCVSMTACNTHAVRICFIHLRFASGVSTRMWTFSPVPRLHENVKSFFFGCFAAFSQSVTV
eukprot:Opistho-2@73812